jgi:hypothetical protein
MKTKNFKIKNVVDVPPDAAGRAATPACAPQSDLSFAHAKKIGSVCAQSPANLTARRRLWFCQRGEDRGKVRRNFGQTQLKSEMCAGPPRKNLFA